MILDPRPGGVATYGGAASAVAQAEAVGACGGLVSTMALTSALGGGAASTVSLAEVVSARGGARLSEEEGWALLCAAVQVPT